MKHQWPETEEFLQFIWKHGIYGQGKLSTTCGTELEILCCGVQNFHAGPDFINARIRIGQLEWAGNVEIHRQSSDWEKHGHHLDPSYNNVILHVVRIFDSIAFTNQGHSVQTLVLEFPVHLARSFKILKAADHWLPCDHFIRDISSIRMQHWLTTLQTERIREKSGKISKLLLYRGIDWEEAFYMVLASGLGLPINIVPFELLVSGIPLNVILRWRDSLPDLEGILFGQAGFLQTGQTSGPYERKLLESYRRIKRSLSKKPVPLHLWKFLRLRPASFPTIRIAQFASLLHRRSPLMDTLLHTSSLMDTEQLLRVSASEYWNTHYLFGKCSPENEKSLGLECIHGLIINSVIPFLFTYGRLEQKIDSLELGAYLLSALRSESNQIIRNWIKSGIKPRNAFESQALIHLHNGYCKKKRCLDCQIGTGFLKADLPGNRGHRNQGSGSQ